MAYRRIILWVLEHPLIGSLGFALWITLALEVLLLLLPKYNWRLALALSPIPLVGGFLGMFLSIRTGWLEKSQ